MRAGLLCIAAVAVLLTPLLQAAQQQQQQPERPGVQVGVPEGRGGAPAAPAGRRAGPPAGPAPRNAAGRVVLGGANPAVKGVWLPMGIAEADDAKTVPLQSWARALLENRRKFELEPHTRCKPSGGFREFLTPYGVEFVELPELQRIFIFDIGGPHTYRTVYMDGRTHPTNLEPSYYGHSIGWWEGDTLVVDTTGYNESFWIDRRGTPTTDRLRLQERFTRVDERTMRYDMTADDPGSLTAPWKLTYNLRWEDGTELFEYVCQQMNYAPMLMVGEGSSIERTNPIAP